MITLTMHVDGQRSRGCRCLQRPAATWCRMAAQTRAAGRALGTHPWGRQERGDFSPGCSSHVQLGECRKEMRKVMGWARLHFI